MARLPRLLVPGHLHLVLLRSAAGLAVFRTETDFELYLASLGLLAREHEVRVHAYALLPQQVLLLVTPESASSVSRLMQAQGRRFGAAYNRAYQRVGALWEGRFRATVIDAQTFGLACVQFVEAAPLRSGDASVAADYRWSSAAHHAGRRHDPLITEHALHWRLGNTPFDREVKYRDSVHQLQAQTLHETIEGAVLKGWVLGSSDFKQLLSELTDRRLTSLPQGRPRRAGPKKD